MAASWPLNDEAISKQNKKSKPISHKNERKACIKESTCMKIVAMEKQQDMPTNNFAKFCQN